MSRQTTTQHRSDCFVCGEELHYAQYATRQTCFYCGERKETNLYCGNGHYVCDTCHSGKANDLIERYCRNTDATSPLSMALTLMNNPLLKIHGPEHHFLVPAVLLASFYNLITAKAGEVAEKLGQARKRAEVVTGGFCGYWGACGAAVGAGIFVSLITGATPLSDNERKLANKITSDCLRVISENGGPRCCKRESLSAIITTIGFVAQEFGVTIPWELPKACPFTTFNRECMRNSCRFYGDQASERESQNQS